MKAGDIATSQELERIVLAAYLTLGATARQTTLGNEAAAADLAAEG